MICFYVNKLVCPHAHNIKSDSLTIAVSYYGQTVRLTYCYTIHCSVTIVIRTDINFFVHT